MPEVFRKVVARSVQELNRSIRCPQTGKKNSGNQGKATFVSTLQASCRRRRMWVRNLWQIRTTDTFFFSITYNDPNLCFHVSLLFNLILS